MRGITESKLLSALSETAFELVEPLPEKLNKKIKIPTRCKCGAISARRVSDLICGVRACRSCIGKDTNAIDRTRGTNGKHKHQYIFTPNDVRIKQSIAGAKRRCTNQNDAGYRNYGGRGIEFRFKDVKQAFLWVKNNLGEPNPNDSLDRVDNDGHYEAGNLRWADRTTQRLNQRSHFRGNKHSLRISDLHRARPDYSRESIRSFVMSGMTDEQILNKRKGEHTT